MAARYRRRGRSAREIARAFEKDVHAGRILPGAALPAIRQLSATLGVSPATVASAYGMLRARGLVTGAGRQGTRIAARPPSPVSRRAPPVAYGLVDLASGNPDPELLPPLEPALGVVSRMPHLYGDPTELRALMHFLAGEFAADGIRAAATTLVSGALDGIHRVLREHLRAGDAVAVEDPAFPGLLDLLGTEGFAVIAVPIDDEGPLPEGMAGALRRARAVIVTPRAQNPTGAVLTSVRAAALRRLVRRHQDVVLIENDPVGPVAGAPAVTITDAAARWAVIRSTSKFLGPDLRCAAIAGDELTIARVEGRQAFGPRWVSTILQQLVLALWSDPAHGRLLARAAEVYARRRNALLDALASRGIAAHGRSGFNVWIPVQGEARVVAALAEAGWAVMAGERFRLQAGPGIRVTASTLQASAAERFAADLAAIVQPSVPRYA